MNVDRPRLTTYDPSVGWLAVPKFLSVSEVQQVLALCAELLDRPAAERRFGDKVGSGTRHLTELDDRSELIDDLVDRPALSSVVTAILGRKYKRMQVSYRSPQPSFGGQKLHADEQPKLDGGPDIVATAIVALTDFTETNGATRVVPGSHRRPDLQSLAGSLDSHPDEILLTGPAGTAFVFTGHLLHSGTPNLSDAERPALQLVWHL